MKIITIGDLHGSASWKKVVPEEWDRIVFIGDYVDSFYHRDDEILKNLHEVIELKNAYSEKVILLWGNHDLAYYFRAERRHLCTGFRDSMFESLSGLFNSNKNLFQAAWQTGKHLWTHAGVMQRWFTEFIDAQVKTQDSNLAATFNRLSDEYFLPLFHVGPTRGGRHPDGGIFWADRPETLNDPLMNYHQIIGHTKTGNGILRYFSEDRETSVTYTDCLESKEEFFEIEL